MRCSPTAKRTLANFAVLFGTILATLIAFEIGFRVWNWLGPDRGTRPPNRGPVARMGELVQPAKDPDLIHEYRPNLPGFTNSASMRGREYSVERPSNTIRIAGIGDSVMAGDHYDAEQLFMAVLERLLNEAATPPTRFEVLNFAVGGYNTVQELIAFKRKALAYDLDWVILGLVINDCEAPVYLRAHDEQGKWRLIDRFEVEAKLRYGAGLDPEHLPWWAHSMFLRWVHNRIYSFALHKQIDIPLMNLSDRYSGLGNFRRAVGEMAELCRRNNTRLLAVSLTEDVATDHKEDPRKRWHGLVRDLTEREGLNLLEMYPYVMEHLKRTGIRSYRHYWSGDADPHPNGEGHRLIAEMIFEKLKSMGILEQKPRPVAKATNVGARGQDTLMRETVISVTEERI